MLCGDNPSFATLISTPGTSGCAVPDAAYGQAGGGAGRTACKLVRDLVKMDHGDLVFGFADTQLHDSNTQQ